MRSDIFKTKTDEELYGLYKEFLEDEQHGFPENSCLGIIKKQYEERFGVNAVLMLQIELTREMADRWFSEHDPNKLFYTFTGELHNDQYILKASNINEAYEIASKKIEGYEDQGWIDNEVTEMIY